MIQFYHEYIQKLKRIQNFKIRVKVKIEKRNMIQRLFFYVVKIKILYKDKIFKEEKSDHKKSIFSDAVKTYNQNNNLDITKQIFSKIKYLTYEALIDGTDYIKIKCEDLVNNINDIPYKKKYFMNNSYYKDIFSVLLLILSITCLMIIYTSSLDILTNIKHIFDFDIKIYELHYITNFISTLSLINIHSNNEIDIITKYSFKYQNTLIEFSMIIITSHQRYELNSMIIYMGI
jgi:hypothetical protein